MKLIDLARASTRGITSSSPTVGPGGLPQSVRSEPSNSPSRTVGRGDGPSGDSPVTQTGAIFRIAISPIAAEIQWARRVC